nr:uncharacterized protein LOC113696490 [Coffea arabica]
MGDNRGKKRAWGEKWVAMGDFNDICSNGEKWGEREGSEGSFREFNSFISDNELVDIGCKGVPWTWSNTWEGEGEIRERLDRCLGSVGWVQKYENAAVEHIEIEASDHCLLLMDTKSKQRRAKRRFFFDQRWARDEASIAVIKRAWGLEQNGSRMFRVVKRIKECRIALIEWNKSLKGNTKAKIQELKEKLRSVREENEPCNKGVITTLKLQLSKAYKDEELFWSQKSRSRWLKEGDKNTAYFHLSVMAARKRNNISILQKANGEWCTSAEEIKAELSEHYAELFNSSNPSEFEEVLQGIPCTISNLANTQLIKPVTELEIKQAIFSMFPNKAPGVDGMPPLFFQTYWHIIKNDIVNAVTSFFHSGNILTAINETIISIIPKVDNPVVLTNYRPISLCTVLYKTISKILANRLQKVLVHCINPSQSAFVPGRQILDNAIIAHEVLHFLKSKRGGRVGFMALKLDMSKTYDRVEWKFLGRIMLHMGFCPTFVRWIMTCISTVSYSFNLNGQNVGYIKPSRGLRQGDPLSPYLFIICMEGLSNFIKKGVDSKQLTGIKVCKDSPMISHLFFADDSLLCCKASKEEAKKVKEIIQTYGQATGQVVNFGKSAMFLTKNTSNRIRGEIREVLGNMRAASSGKYLGLPMTIGRAKNQVFGFWWGGDGLENKVHWVRWSKLTEVKGKGGLGFRDLEAFNVALLAKQIWRVVTNPNLLVSKVLKAKYMKKTDWLVQKPPSTASWCWKSLHKGGELLQQGLYKRVGDGRSIKIWEDRWVAGSCNGKLTTAKPAGCQLECVHELIEEGRWKTDTLHRWFNIDDVELITNIPLSLYERKDRLYWLHSKSGVYTIRTGYVIAKGGRETVNHRIAPDSETSWAIRKHTVWKRLWGLNIKMKLKHFLWRCLQNGLATSEALYQRVGKGSNLCQCCGEATETIEHVFFFCPTAQIAWRLAPLWKARNKRVFQLESEDAKVIIDKAQQEWIEFEEATVPQPRGFASTEQERLSQHNWEPPKEGVVRINTDAAISAKMVRIGLGIVARNWRGDLVKVRGISRRKKGEAATEESLAIRSALEMAQAAGWTKIEVQSDCRNVVSSINAGNVQDCKLQTILEDIEALKTSFDSCIFSFVPRSANGYSHEVAQFATKVVKTIDWQASFPTWLTVLARKDMGGNTNSVFARAQLGTGTPSATVNVQIQFLASPSGTKKKGRPTKAKAIRTINTIEKKTGGTPIHSRMPSRENAPVESNNGASQTSRTVTIEANATTNSVNVSSSFSMWF